MLKLTKSNVTMQILYFRKPMSAFLDRITSNNTSFHLLFFLSTTAYIKQLISITYFEFIEINMYVLPTNRYKCVISCVSSALELKKEIKTFHTKLINKCFVHLSL